MPDSSPPAAPSPAPAETICSACQLILVSPGDDCPRCGQAASRAARIDCSPEESAEAQAAVRLLGLSPENRYGVLDEVGQSGLSVVYRCRDRLLDEVVALKVLRSHGLYAEQALHQFKQEVRIARSIHHPNVATLYDIFLWHGHLAISLEYIPGQDLESLMSSAPLPDKVILSLLRGICAGLDRAHDLGITHRDLKPRNIRIDKRGRPRILDFGLATMARRQTGDARQGRFATAAFMSPEQAADGQPIDHRTDIYSLGVMIFQMATGRLPFNCRSPQEWAQAHLQQPPPSPRSINPDLSEAFEPIILRCLHKQPDRRYQSARELFLDVREALEGRDQDYSTAAPGRARVLVVEDEPATIKLLTGLLQSHDLEVLEATDGARAIQVAQLRQPLFILLDLELPDMDGREVLRTLKQDPKTRDLPVVVMIGVDDEEEGIIAREAGAEFYIHKPVQPVVISLLAQRYES